MTAGTRPYVHCDHSDLDKPVGHRFCEARIDEGNTQAGARAIARKRGWLTGVMSNGCKPPRGVPGHWDYCPDHRAAHEPPPQDPKGTENR